MSVTDSNAQSPSALQGVTGLLGGGPTSWRQALDGTGALVGAVLVGGAAALVVRILRRR